MGRARDLTKKKIHEVKALIDAKIFSNREISRRLNISEASVRRIKGKVQNNEDLGPQRNNNSVRKSKFSLRGERLKNICVENRIASTNEITTQLNESNVSNELLQLDTKACRPARKPKLTPAMKAKRLLWARNHQNKDLEFVVILIACGVCGIVAVYVTIPLISIYLFVGLMLSGLATVVVKAATVDLFSTSLRAMAVCITLMFGRLGSVVGANVIGLLLDYECSAAFLFTGNTLIISGLLAVFTPNKTKSVKESTEIPDP